DVINRTSRPVVTENAPGGSADAQFAIVRQVDPTLVTITNNGASGPDLLINGTIENPIGETDVTSQFGAITSSSSRSGVSSFDGTHHSLIRTNILHLYAGTNIATASPYLNVDLIVWVAHPEDFTTFSGTDQYIDLLTRLRDSSLTDPNVSSVVPVIPIDHMVALNSIFVLLR